MTGTNLQTGDGWTHLNSLEVINNAQVDGNLTVLGTITGVVELTQMQVVTPITTVGNGVLTAAGFAGGFINRSGPVAAFTDTTDTAAAIVAALPGAVVNSTITANIKNGNAFMQTLAAGTGVTLPATKLNPAFYESNYLITLTNVTAGSEAVTFTHINTNPIVTAPSVANPYATAISTVGAGTLTAASFVGGFISRGGAQSSTAFADTTDTAAAIIAACPSLVNKIGTSLLIEYSNATNATATIGGGMGVTVSGTAIIPPNTVGQFLVTYTAAATLTMVGVGVTQIPATAVTLLGSSTGATALVTANSGTSNTTATIPAITESVALGLSASNTASMGIASTTTLATVPGLSVALQAAGVYAITAKLPVSGVTASNGIKVALAATNSLSVTSMTVDGWNWSGTTLEAVTNANALGNDIGSGNTCTVFKIDGTITVNAGGTLNLQAAQHTSTSLTTTIGAGGFMSLTRIS